MHAPMLLLTKIWKLSIIQLGLSHKVVTKNISGSNWVQKQEFIMHIFNSWFFGSSSTSMKQGATTYGVQVKICVPVHK
jgi:hypothetical protein